ncbi:MAG: hypothetical protein JF588_01340 [Caulobacterales bacterium]|nr:hypothetical protein [Caulobacterales bacterium]
MSTSKHPAPGRAVPPRDDLETDPGIGASRGTTIAGEDPHILREDGENTEEGDVGNDTDAAGKPTPLERHRTNR